MGEWRRKEDEDGGGMHFASGQPLNKTGIVAGADKKFHGSCWLIFAALEIAPVFSFSLPPPPSLFLSRPRSIARFMKCLIRIRIYVSGYRERVHARALFSLD